MAFESTLTATPTTATGAAAAANGQSATTSRASIANNFDQFLLLLTTQLQNQNPLDPLDTNQFTQQLVQFASVEQQLKSNETLTALLSSTQSQNATNAAAFIGKQVTADGAATQLADGKARWTLNAPRAASDAVISIRDSNGTVVYQERRALAQGENAYVWDGKTNAGGVAGPGTYQITVTARDPAGQNLLVKSQVQGRVTSVDLSGETPVLIVGGSRVSLDAITSISS